MNERHGSLVRAERHYPDDDWRDPLSGGQAYYHCHRPGVEHGHLHLFMPAEPGAELTHLLGIGLDPRGLPLSLFTVNRLAASDADPRFSAWLEQFLRFYAPVIETLLLERNCDLEIPSQVAIDWGADLDKVQQQWREERGGTRG